MVGGSNNVKNTLYLKNSFFKCYFLNLRKHTFRWILTKFNIFISGFKKLFSQIGHILKMGIKWP